VTYHPPRNYIEREACRPKQHEGDVQADVWNVAADPLNLIQSDHAQNASIPERRSCRHQKALEYLIQPNSKIHKHTVEPSDDENGHNDQNPFYWSREHAQVELSYQRENSLGHRGKFFDRASCTMRTNARRESIHTGMVLFPCRQIEVSQRCDLGCDSPPGTPQIKCL